MMGCELWHKLSSTGASVSDASLSTDALDIAFQKSEEIKVLKISRFLANWGPDN